MILETSKGENGTFTLKVEEKIPFFIMMEILNFVSLLSKLDLS